jgi:transposase
MAKPRLSMRKIKEVLRLSYQCGLSARQVALSANVSRSTVKDYLVRAGGDRSGRGREFNRRTKIDFILLTPAQPPGFL